ncbi:transcription factor MafB [Drosophila nasuta]|uniref:Transcription factor MafB n=1 Tax=Drosophila albomicans TaxID=7291 RepID=A0A6P8XNX4_DROAB|nr:transcription factor MafB [Drosophila albomicans]XP_060663591.1 transcription factor MafB [Drosophila nasuta]
MKMEDPTIADTYVQEFNLDHLGVGVAGNSVTTLTPVSVAAIGHVKREDHSPPQPVKWTTVHGAEPPADDESEPMPLAMPLPIAVPEAAAGDVVQLAAESHIKLRSFSGQQWQMDERRLQPLSPPPEGYVGGPMGGQAVLVNTSSSSSSAAAAAVAAAAAAASASASASASAVPGGVPSTPPETPPVVGSPTGSSSCPSQAYAHHYHAGPSNATANVAAVGLCQEMRWLPNAMRADQQPLDLRPLACPGSQEEAEEWERQREYAMHAAAAAAHHHHGHPLMQSHHHHGPGRLMAQAQHPSHHHFHSLEHALPINMHSNSTNSYAGSPGPVTVLGPGGSLCPTISQCGPHMPSAGSSSGASSGSNSRGCVRSILQPCRPLSASSSRSSNNSPRTCSGAYSNATLEDCINDDMLTTLTVRELNKRLHGCPREEVVRLKQKRRTLKNRGYAQNCRSKRLHQRHELEKANRQLNQDLHRLKLEYSRVCQERDTLMQRLQQQRTGAAGADSQSSPEFYL